MYGMFTPSIQGMKSQARALNAIGVNVANVSTGGYKQADVHFESVMSDKIGNDRAFGGVKPKEYFRIDKQGQVLPSSLNTDVALGGRGFFILNSKLDGSGETVYARDGSFRYAPGAKVTNSTTTPPAEVQTQYLVDKNGYYLQGWPANADGTFSASLSALRVDPSAFIDQGQATSEAALVMNLDANEAIGGFFTHGIDVYDSNGAVQSLKLAFTKTGVNQWSVGHASEQTPVRQVDGLNIAGTPEAGDSYSVTVGGAIVTYTVTGAEPDMAAVRDALINAINNDPGTSQKVTAVAGAGAGQIDLLAQKAGTGFTATATASNAGAADNTASVSTTTANVVPTVINAMGDIVFKNDATVDTPQSLTMNLTFDSGATANVVLDNSNMTQYAGNYNVASYEKNGQVSASMIDFNFDSEGYISAVFEDLSVRNIYRVPIATFNNPNGLDIQNGEVFGESQFSGSANITTASSLGPAVFMPNSKEGSNVVLEEQFSKMIMTQQAYKSSTTAFKTADEMLTTAKNMKR